MALDSLPTTATGYLPRKFAESPSGRLQGRLEDGSRRLHRFSPTERSRSEPNSYPDRPAFVSEHFCEGGRSGVVRSPLCGPIYRRGMRTEETTLTTLCQCGEGPFTSHHSVKLGHPVLPNLRLRDGPICPPPSANSSSRGTI